jgi:hypothetical protein
MSSVLEWRDWPTANCRGCMDADREHIEWDGDEWCRACLLLTLDSVLETLREQAEVMPMRQLPTIIGAIHAMEHATA